MLFFQEQFHSIACSWRFFFNAFFSESKLPILHSSSQLCRGLLKTDTHAHRHTHTHKHTHTQTTRTHQKDLLVRGRVWVFFEILHKEDPPCSAPGRPSEASPDCQGCRERDLCNFIHSAKVFIRICAR